MRSGAFEPPGIKPTAKRAKRTKKDKIFARLARLAVNTHFSIMKAVILAAGVGSRLRPLTDTCPKPMLPIAGRPLLARTLDWLRASGVAEAALNLHHLPDVVRAGLGDGGTWGMTLRYSYEHELLGSASASPAGSTKPSR